MATILTVSNHPPYVIPNFFKPKTQEKETQIMASSLARARANCHNRITIYRSSSLALVCHSSMNRSFCYDVLPNGDLKESKQENPKLWNRFFA